MADEITYRNTLSVRKGTLVQAVDSGQSLATMTGTTSIGGVQTVGTSDEALTIGSDVGTLGFAWFLNTATTNYVEIGVKPAGTFYPLIKLKAVESAGFRFGTNAPYVKANTASVNLHYVLYAD